MSSNIISKTTKKSLWYTNQNLLTQRPRLSLQLQVVIIAHQRKCCKILGPPNKRSSVQWQCFCSIRRHFPLRLKLSGITVGDPDVWCRHRLYSRRRTAIPFSGRPLYAHPGSGTYNALWRGVRTYENILVPAEGLPQAQHHSDCSGISILWSLQLYKNGYLPINPGSWRSTFWVYIKPCYTQEHTIQQEAHYFSFLTFYSTHHRYLTMFKLFCRNSRRTSNSNSNEARHRQGSSACNGTNSGADDCPPSYQDAITRSQNSASSLVGRTYEKSATEHTQQAMCHKDEKEGKRNNIATIYVMN